MPLSMGLWEQAYAGVLDARAYGDHVTYEIGADYLSDCEVVEDWGCGLGCMRAWSVSNAIGDRRLALALRRCGRRSCQLPQ